MKRVIYVNGAGEHHEMDAPAAMAAYAADNAGREAGAWVGRIVPCADASTVIPLPFEEPLTSGTDSSLIIPRPPPEYTKIPRRSPWITPHARVSPGMKFAEGIRLRKGGVEPAVSIGDSLSAVIDHIEGEKRKDRIVNTRNLEMVIDSQGQLRIRTINNGEGIRLTRHATSKLLAMTEDLLPAVSFIDKMKPHETAYVFNSRVSYQPARMIRMRQRYNVYANDEEAFAFVSDGRYNTETDGIHMARSLRDMFHKLPLVGEAVYNPENTEFHLNIWMNEAKRASMKKGDRFSPGVRIRSRDDGTASRTVAAYVLEIVCGNGMTRGVDVGSVVDRHSKMEMPEVTSRVVEILRSNLASHEQFVARMEVLDNTSTEGLYPGMDLNRVLRSVAAERRLADATKGIQRDTLVELLLLGYTQGEGREDTLGSILGAVTRLHDKVPVAIADDVEEAASHLALQWERAIE